MRVIAGPEKKARLLSEKERKITAYHEMGHALVGHYLENTNPIHKITIVSRGQALGLTISLPTEDRYLTTQSALMDDLAMTLGGRAAEELVFHEVTTGAANDLEKVTATSKAMIMRYGMSEKLGPRVLGRDHGQPFLGREMGNEPDYSDEIAREIDDEIRRVIEEAHETAHRVLREHMDELHKLSAILIERETIDKDQFERLLAGEAEESVFPERGRRAAGRAARRGPRAQAGAEAEAAPRPGRHDAAARARTPPPSIRFRRSPRGPSGRRCSSVAQPVGARRARSARDRGGERAEQVDRGPPAETASTSASSDRAERRARRAAGREQREPAEVGARLVGDRAAQLERPVAELGDGEQRAGDDGRARVERVALEPEQRDVLAAEERDRHRDREPRAAARARRRAASAATLPPPRSRGRGSRRPRPRRASAPVPAATSRPSRAAR